MLRHRWISLAFAGLALVRAGGGAQSLIQQIPASLRQYAATYEVRLSFTGYGGLIEGAPNCQVNQNGTDVMVGTLTGVENPSDQDEDVVYTGVLTRTTKMDFCETKPAPTEDQRAWCVVTLDGLAVMEVELTVYGESGRGAWMKAAPGIGPARANVGGSCNPPETQQVRADYPTAADGGGASPNGQPIDDSKARDRNGPIQFFGNGLARLRPGTYPPDSPKGGWTLEVIRRVP